MALPADRPQSHPIVLIELILGNTTDARSGSGRARWPRPARRTLRQVQRFEQVGSTAFIEEPGQVRTVTAVFEPRVLAGPDQAEMSLEIGDFTRVGAILAQTGQTADPDPFGGREDRGRARRRSGPPRLEAAAAIDPRSVSVDLNAGVPGPRALEHRRLVVVDVSVSGVGGGGAAESWSSAFRRLEVGGPPSPRRGSGDRRRRRPITTTRSHVFTGVRRRCPICRSLDGRTGGCPPTPIRRRGTEWSCRILPQ